MRKKSHLSLAKFLVKNMQVQGLVDHRKAFYIGSILPDLKPSFLTKRHTFDETFGILINEIKKITVEFDIEKGINSYFARHLGVVTHYLSDYCTYPHNNVFHGSISEHVLYEKELKHSLKEYFSRVGTNRERKQCHLITSLDEIVHSIVLIHKEYLKEIKCVNEDINYIIELCYKVVNTIVSFLEKAISQIHCGDNLHVVCE